MWKNTKLCWGKKMEVLYVTTVPAPYKVDLFEELGKLCKLTVIFENNSVSYRGDGWMRKKFNNFTALFLEGIKHNDKVYSRGIVKCLRKNNYDAIVIGVYSTFSQMLAQQYMIRNKIPYIISSDGGLTKVENKLNQLIKKHFISSASAWFSTGKVTTEYLMHYGAVKEKIYIYPFTSIKRKDILDQPLPVEVKKQYRAKLGMKEEKIILSVGQFIYRKGYDVLMRACKGLDKSIGVYIVGGNPTEEYIEMQRSMNLSNIHFLEFMDKTALANYYKAANLFVLPTREDIWGVVVNEAMAYGLPVITTNKCVAGLEMIECGLNGEIVKANNDKELYGAIRKLINCENTNMARKCLEISRDYTIEAMAHAHMDILRLIMKEKKYE